MTSLWKVSKGCKTFQIPRNPCAWEGVILRAVSAMFLSRGTYPLLGVWLIRIACWCRVSVIGLLAESSDCLHLSKNDLFDKIPTLKTNYHHHQQQKVTWAQPSFVGAALADNLGKGLIKMKFQIMALKNIHTEILFHFNQDGTIRFHQFSQFSRPRNCVDHTAVLGNQTTTALNVTLHRASRAWCLHENVSMFFPFTIKWSFLDKKQNLPQGRGRAPDWSWASGSLLGACGLLLSTRQDIDNNQEIKQIYLWDFLTQMYMR